MKVTNFADKKNGLEGSVEDIVMGIDNTNHLTLLNSLTHLYSNPVMAAFREYCANASDAHKDSGQTKPFEVSFPHRHEGQSNLRIRDYGKGMTEEQITKVYSQYGATTKANNNAQVGGFGLGSKSGLAVSNKLYVNTTANGILIKAQILKNKDNEAVIRILSREPSTAPSGTEIILPLTTPQLDELRKKAEEELVGYKPEQVKLNGTPILYTVHDKNQFIPVNVGSNVIAYIARNSMNESNIYGRFTLDPSVFKSNYSLIMGGVYYPSLPSTGSVNGTDKEFEKLVEDLDRRFKNSPKIILNVPVGSVDLPPHRDSIIDTPKTWESLKGLLSNLRMGLTTATEAHLNEMNIKEASKVVGSMRSLFSPLEQWKHKGVTYENSMAFSSVPMIYTHLSSYGNATTRLNGALTADYFTALHLRVNSPDYNYGGHRQKKVIKVVNLVVEQGRYDEVVAYDKNTNAHYSVRNMKMKKPRLSSFVTRYLKTVLDGKYGAEEFYVVVTPVGTKIPAHFTGAIDLTTTEDAIKAEYRKLFPPEPKKTVTQQHCRVSKNKIEYSLISTDEKIVYFGGKDAYGTEEFMHSNSKGFNLPQMSVMRMVSTGGAHESKDYMWAHKGLLNIIEFDASLIAVGNTRSSGLFKKVFKEAVPLGEVVMKFYDNLDADRQLAIQHAYSILGMWSEGTDALFSILGNKGYYMDNRSIELMFNEPELISVAHYLFTFKDNYVEGLLEWKKKFVESLKDKELAWKMLLPVQSLLGEVFYTAEKSAEGAYSTRLALRTPSQIHPDDVAGFVNKLTAY